MLDLPRQEVSIDQYNKILEAENIAKLREIERLRKQMDLLTLSTHLQHLNETKCKQCLRKQQQIDTLIKAVKALRPDPQTTLLSHAQRTLVSQQGYQNQLQKSFKLSNCRSGDSLEGKDTKSVNKYVQIFSTVGNESEVISHLRLQKNIFLDQIIMLKQKLSQFQRKIELLEQINKKLDRKNNKSSSQQKSEYGLLPITVKQQSINASSNIDTKRAPMFSKMRNNMVSSFMTPVQKTEQLSYHQQYATPSFKQTNSIMYRSSAQRPSDFSARNNILSQKSSTRRYKSRDQDLIEERRKSLNHKIKILQGENRRLRTQVFER